MSIKRSSDEQSFRDRSTLSDWSECPQGELSQMVRHLSASQARARNRKLVQTGVVSMVLVACGVVVVGSLTNRGGGGSFTFGGITCAECASHFAEYHGYLTDSKEFGTPELVASMTTHLGSCPICQSRFNETYPGVLKTAFSVTPRTGLHDLLPLLAVSRQPAFY